MTDKTNAWPTEVERRHGSTTSSHDTTGACDYFDGEAWRPERRRMFSTNWHDMDPRYLWVEDEMIEDRRHV